MNKKWIKKQLVIQTYGYEYTKLDCAVTIFLFSIVVSTICVLHKLNFFYMTIVIATLLLFLPILISSYFIYCFEKNKFEEYCQYYEYMKLYFKTYKKIKLALEEVSSLFPRKSKMRKCIEDAIFVIHESGDYVVALDKITKEYNNSYLQRFHNLLITGEQHGSDSVYENLDFINFDLWKKDIQLHQNKKKTFRYILYGMTIFAFILSYYGVHMFTETMDGLFTDAKYQFYTFLNIESIMILFIIIYISFVNKKWIRSDD